MTDLQTHQGRRITLRCGTLRCVPGKIPAGVPTLTANRPSTWLPRPLPVDDARCKALLWYARHPERYAGDVRCTRVATYRLTGTEVLVCDLHADALRFGRTIATANGTCVGREIEPLEPNPEGPRFVTARLAEPIESGRANATRAAFPNGLPARPEVFDDRRWRVVRRRWDGATLAEIAGDLGISRERAHQLEESALRALGAPRAPTNTGVA